MSRERERYDEIGKKIKRESDAAAAAVAAALVGQQGGRRQMQLGITTGILNTITPCAACKLLRRRCAQECPFSPYFSPHEPHKFASVHKVFGASNVSKLLMEVPESQRADAANSLVYEANVRLRDPVYGCMGAISALQQQLQVLQAELNAIRSEILKYKYRDNINLSNISINNTTNSSTTNNNNNNINSNNNSNNNNNNNINNNATTSHLSFFSTTSGVVTLATQSSPPSPPPPPPAPALRNPPNSSVSSSMYTQQQQQQPSGGSNDYSSISNENMSYFG
ncbi:hypothetical protein vseg_005622 [Gypsophila vaccaria]